jgi:hypothetical protein
LLYVVADPTASAIIAADQSNFPPARVVSGSFGPASRLWATLCVNPLSPTGAAQDVVTDTWVTNNRVVRGVVCRALYRDRVSFKDAQGQDILFRGGTMLVPWGR